MSCSVPFSLYIPVLSFPFQPRLVTKLVTSFSVLHHIWSPGSAFLRAVDATETDAFRVLVVQDFDGVAIEDGDDGAGKLCSEHTSLKEDTADGKQGSVHEHLDPLKGAGSSPRSIICPTDWSACPWCSP